MRALLTTVLIVSFLSIFAMPIRSCQQNTYTVRVHNKSGRLVNSFIVGGSALDKRIDFGAVRSDHFEDRELRLDNDGDIHFWSRQGTNRTDGVARARLSAGGGGGVRITILPYNHYVMGPI